MLGLAKLLDDANAPQHSCLILLHCNPRVYPLHYLPSMQRAAAAQWPGSHTSLCLAPEHSVPALSPPPPAIHTVKQSS